MSPRFSFSRDDILSVLPHRPPFLFVDRVIELVPDKRVRAEYHIPRDAPWFAGHFPQRAIMPGVLVTDALAQTGGCLWGFSKKVAGDDNDEPELFYLAAATMKYVNPAYPDERLILSAASVTSLGVLFNYEVEASVGRRLISKGALTLAMVEGAL
ncbi:MAG: hypothetical protein GF398_05260 [Chitinivibrionales bacterium]|nr:hypothetical protein [Chitinivibrionales bacterium]